MENRVFGHRLDRFFTISLNLDKPAARIARVSPIFLLFLQGKGVEKGGREKNLCPFGVPRVGAVSNDGR